MIAVWGSLSATWILIANAWMQHPVGMTFNPDTMINEMTDFWAVVFNPVALVKMWHTLTQWFTVASVVVIWISCWYLLKNREKEFAYMSIKIAAIFWMFGIFFTVLTWDFSGEEVANYQPMKLAAIEAHYEGSREAWFNALAIFWPVDKDWKNEIIWKLHIPKALSLIVHKDLTTYIPWIDDLLYWNKEEWIIWAIDRIEPGKLAINSLREYKMAKKEGRVEDAEKHLEIFRLHEKDFGYWYFEKDNLWELVPYIPLLFYAFRYMVSIWFFMMLIYFPWMLYLGYKKILHKYKYIHIFALFMIPAVYLASELGWVVAEVGRQPWVVYEMLPTKIGVSATNSTTVMATFFWFLTIFTILLIAALKIAFAEIRKWPGIDK